MAEDVDEVRDEVEVEVANEEDDVESADDDEVDDDDEDPFPGAAPPGGSCHGYVFLTHSTSLSDGTKFCSIYSAPWR